MPANVDEMFSVREMPWHREGHILGDYPGWDEARKLAGLDWEPVPMPAYAKTLDDDQLMQRVMATLSTPGMTETDRAIMTMGMIKEAYKEEAGFNRVVRSDTGDTLAVVRDTYAIINHSAFGEILEATLEVGQGQIKLETGGCLEGGRKVWLLARMDEPVVIPGDTSATYPYLALTARHDAMGGVSLRSTAVRIVCANTFGASELEGERSGLVYTFRHVGKAESWRDKIDQAREAVLGARQEFADYREMMADLLGITLTQAQINLFVNEFIPMPPQGLITDRVRSNVEAARTRLFAVIDSRTVEGAGIKFTAAGMVNAAGEYLDHVRKARTWETRLNRTIIRPEPLKAKAKALALEVAKA
jgi:phage/plasmid-like protein (TIGR03299 family)